MTTRNVKTVDILEVSEVSSDETYASITDGSYDANIEDLLPFFETLEDEEDIREGLKALADEEGTITWEQYQRQRAERFTFSEFSVQFRGEHDNYTTGYKDGKWHCSCHFFSAWGLCSHTMALQKILSNTLSPEALAHEEGAITWKQYQH